MQVVITGASDDTVRVSSDLFTEATCSSAVNLGSSAKG